MNTRRSFLALLGIGAPTASIAAVVGFKFEPPRAAADTEALFKYIWENSGSHTHTITPGDGSHTHTSSTGWVRLNAKTIGAS